MRLKHIGYIVLSIVCFSSFVLLSRLPKSDEYLLTGMVTGKGTAQGYGDSGDKLRVEIDAGKVVSVYVPFQMGARVGDTVELSAYDRYVFTPRYRLLKVVRE